MMKLTWHDITNATHSDLKKKYKLNDRQLEQQIRPHIDGANPQERRELYKKVWDRRS